MTLPAGLVPTEVYDSYWRFAHERQQVYLRRLSRAEEPWTRDPVLASYRFTNAYRAADRVSQYLIRDVQYGEGRSQAPDELFFRTLLFKLFNRIETWELIERETGRVAWQSSSFAEIATVMDTAMARGRRLYSAAYIMPSPAFGHARKHANHLALLQRMMEDGLPARVAAASGLDEVYRLILAYPGIGPFLAFQYAIDLNYSTLTNFSEADFVVAGPGALDGIAKCFSDTGRRSAEEVIHLMAARQEEEFARLGLRFEGLFGRSLQPIDCQNLFCEISKYARVAHPHVRGVADRKRIKQGYVGSGRTPPAQPFFPPKWSEIVLPVFCKAELRRVPAQGEMF